MNIQVEQLLIPLKITFKQASSTRKVGESIWVTAERNGVLGLGEGCPRTYSTGEDVSSGIEWVASKLEVLQSTIKDLSSLKNFVSDNVLEIDQHPSAWCAIETALLDLFARDAACSVEKLIGLRPPLMAFKYTAILGDGSIDSFGALVGQYLQWGFRDFKIKIMGDAEEDIAKINLLGEKCAEMGAGVYSWRVDANNFFNEQPDKAIEHLSKLPDTFIGVEEPVSPKMSEALSHISLSLNKPVILDESITTKADIEAYSDLGGQFIANLKVSRIGGILRGLEIVKELKYKGWKIIIGAHVGETSILTRAAMCLAQAAGDQLIGHEGCFGTRLLEKDHVFPSLQFGKGGILDLSKPYLTEGNKGKEEIFSENWNIGWGLTIL